jgi:hypothetical protein
MTFHDDFARDGRHFAVKHANNQVEVIFLEWNRKWHLDGTSVKCRECGENQAISDSGKSFEDQHSAGCTISKLPGQYPLGELSEILSLWRMEIWDENGNEA